MKKLYLIILITSLVLNIIQPLPAKAYIAQTRPYTAIVKIKTYALDENFNFGLNSSGSGTIINDKGLILTNYHVIEVQDEFDNSPKASAYQVCLTYDVDESADCSYTADIVSQDQNRDIALLQIRAIPGFDASDNDFAYLPLNQNDNLTVGSVVTAIGYPSIGGETVTISSGIISGQTEKNGGKWIKTDALTSFGNSGGALINNLNQLIGIPTEIAIDDGGNVGYAISSLSINQWINSHANDKPQLSSLNDQLISFSKKAKSLEDSLTFKSTQAPFIIKKPSDNWEFIYLAENLLVITKKYLSSPDEKPGTVVIVTEKTAYPYDIEAIDSYIKKTKNNHLLQKYDNLIQNKTINFANQQAKLISYLQDENEINQILVPYQNSLIRLVYAYGDNDKQGVKDILDSFTFEKADSSFKELKDYRNESSPYFSIKAKDGWTITKNNSKVAPINLENKQNKNQEITMDIEKIGENIKNLSPGGFITYMKNNIEKSNLKLKDLGIKIEVIDTNSQYKLSSKLKNVSTITIATKNLNNDSVLYYQTSYNIRLKDLWISIYTVTHDSDAIAAKKSLKDMSKVVKWFKFN